MEHDEQRSTGLDDYERAIFAALINARDIQDFLWAEESWKVEARKRLLQQASLSIKALVALRNAS